MDVQRWPCQLESGNWHGFLVMAEFTIGPNSYRSRKLNAFEQLFIVKRLAGVIKDILTPELLDSIVNKTISDPLKYLPPFADAVSKLPDADLEFIINTCAKATTRKQGQLMSPLVVNDTYMFQDINGPQYVMLVYYVLSEDLGGFFDELRSMLAPSVDPKSK